MDIDFDLTQPGAIEGARAALLAGLPAEERLYLRARLALAGITDVDEVETPADAAAWLERRPYSLVVLGTDDDPDWAWTTAQALAERPAPPAVLAITRQPDAAAFAHAAQARCFGLLESPLNPRELLALLGQL